MATSLFLAPGRASALGDCERGCTENIMSPDCPTHGFPVTRVRVRHVQLGTFITGELTLFEGTRFMRWVREGQADIKPRERLSLESVELVDVESSKVVRFQ